MELDSDQRKRYARQIALPELGEEGQLRLLGGSVLIVGAGGLGSPAALYLAAAGVGRIGIVDGDRVELSNLQRQILHGTASLGRFKTDSATERLQGLNPDTRVETYCARLVEEGAADLVRSYDFVLDCTDNFATKFLIADVCHRKRKPYSHAGVRGFLGQTLTVVPGCGACYRCLFSDRPEEEVAAPAGPLGVLPGIVGTVQAAEAIRYLAGTGRLLIDRLLVVDALNMVFRLVPLRRNPECPLCGGGDGAAGACKGKNGQSMEVR